MDNWKDILWIVIILSILVVLVVERIVHGQAWDEPEEPEEECKECTHMNEYEVYLKDEETIITISADIVEWQFQENLRFSVKTEDGGLRIVSEFAGYMVQGYCNAENKV